MRNFGRSSHIGQRFDLKLGLFATVVLLHWAEHGLQMYQIMALGWPRHEALGLLGLWQPHLVHSEWLHFGYAVFMLAGLVVLRDGFTGAGRWWWLAALWIQVWHFIEHLLLFVQAQAGFILWGAAMPTSVVQTMFPQMRAELHFFYNAAVTIPMVIAMVCHYGAKRREAVVAGSALAVG